MVEVGVGVSVGGIGVCVGVSVEVDVAVGRAVGVDVGGVRPKIPHPLKTRLNSTKETIILIMDRPPANQVEIQSYLICIALPTALVNSWVSLYNS